MLLVVAVVEVFCIVLGFRHVLWWQVLVASTRRYRGSCGCSWSHFNSEVRVLHDLVTSYAVCADQKCSKQFFYSLSQIIMACIHEIWWACAHKMVCYNGAGVILFTIIRQVVFVRFAGLDSFPTKIMRVHAEFEAV